MVILVVDDDKECRKSLEELLKLSGYRVITAGSGEEALEALKAKDISLMLVDLMMPGMGGEEFIKMAWQKGHKYPTLVVTALAPWQTAGLTGLGVGYVRKPYDGKMLVAAIETLLRKETIWE